MSEPRRESPAWAYALEDAVFHGLCFGLLGPAVAFIVLAVVSSVSLVPRTGLAQAITDAVSFIDGLGTLYGLIAFIVIGPMMLITGLLVSVIARYLRDERWLGVAGFIIAAAMMLIFIPITGEPGYKNRLPLPWNGPLQMFASGLTGFLLVRATRFLRIWRDHAAKARGGASS